MEPVQTKYTRPTVIPSTVSISRKLKPRSHKTCHRRQTRTGGNEHPDKWRQRRGPEDQDRPIPNPAPAAGDGRQQQRVGAELQVDLEEMRLDPLPMQQRTNGDQEGAVQESRQAQTIGIERVKAGDPQPETSGQRRQRQRKHEAVVEAVRERAEHQRGDQQVRVPAVEDLERNRSFDEGQPRRQQQAARNRGRSRSRTGRFDLVVGVRRPC